MTSLQTKPLIKIIVQSQIRWAETPKYTRYILYDFTILQAVDAHCSYLADIGQSNIKDWQHQPFAVYKSCVYQLDVL